MFDNTWTSDDGINAPLGNNYSFTEFDSCEVYMELVGGSEGKVPVEFNVPLDEQFNVTGLYEWLCSFTDTLFIIKKCV